MFLLCSELKWCSTLQRQDECTPTLSGYTNATVCVDVWSTYTITARCVAHFIYNIGHYNVPYSTMCMGEAASRWLHPAPGAFRKWSVLPARFTPILPKSIRCTRGQAISLFWMGTFNATLQINLAHQTATRDYINIDVIYKKESYVSFTGTVSLMERLKATGSQTHFSK